MVTGGAEASDANPVKNMRATLERARRLRATAKELGDRIERASQAQATVVRRVRRAKARLDGRTELASREICDIVRGALSLRDPPRRGPRAPNGSGPPRRYLREDCSDPTTTALKRLRCMKACCRVYRQHITPKGTRPGDRAHCEGIDCPLGRKRRGAPGDLSGAARDRTSPGAAPERPKQPARKRPAPVNAAKSNKVSRSTAVAVPSRRAKRAR
jgi:hypothetical protein